MCQSQLKKGMKEKREKKKRKRKRKTGRKRGERGKEREREREEKEGNKERGKEGNSFNKLALLNERRLVFDIIGRDPRLDLVAVPLELLDLPLELCLVLLLLPLVARRIQLLPDPVKRLHSLLHLFEHFVDFRYIGKAGSERDGMRGMYQRRSGRGSRKRERERERKGGERKSVSVGWKRCRKMSARGKRKREKEGKGG